MSDVMKWLEEIKKSQRKHHAERIKTVLSTDVPQHILATKEIAEDLSSGTDGYVRNEMGFFFTERLVNRLMYLSYLHGCAEIDEKSFNKGRNAAIEMMREKLEVI